MTTSNEPGYYEDSNFGIRIENICCTVNAKTANNFGGKMFCCFETISLAPLQRNLIDVTVLSQAEQEWVNAYHLKVRHTLLPIMQEHFPDAVDYLLEQTEAI